MQSFVDKLVAKSEEWITSNSIKDKKSFTIVIKNVLSELPSPLKEQLSNNPKIINLLWEKIKQKYDQSPNNKFNLFFTDNHISNYIKQNQNNNNNKQRALKSDAASLKHYSNPLNPFFKSYSNINYDEINNLLDILLKNKQYNDEWLSLIQYRFNQFLFNIKNANNKSLSKKIKQLHQKIYRLMCHNIGSKNISLNVGLLFNRILLICTDDIVLTDISMNTITFIRVFLDYKLESVLAFETLRKNINIKLLITKLLQTAKHRYSRDKQWSNTQQLIFLWTVYECNKNDFLDKKCLFDLISFSETNWLYNGLLTVFSDTSMDSFADFTDLIYQYNMLSLHDVDDDDDDSDSDDDDDDIMNFTKETAIIDNIKDMDDDVLFTVDTNKRSLEEFISDQSKGDHDGQIIVEPVAKKQKLG